MELEIFKHFQRYGRGSVKNKCILIVYIIDQKFIPIIKGLGSTTSNYYIPNCIPDGSQVLTRALFAIHLYQHAQSLVKPRQAIVMINRLVRTLLSLWNVIRNVIWPNPAQTSYRGSVGKTMDSTVRCLVQIFWYIMPELSWLRGYDHGLYREVPSSNLLTAPEMSLG